jgi:hypothetical protein
VFDVNLVLTGAGKGEDVIEVVARTLDGRAAIRLVPISIGAASGVGLSRLAPGPR